MRRLVRIAVSAAVVVALPLLGACVEFQSVIAPSGTEAKRVAALWWILLAGAIAILAGVAAIALVAMAGREGWRRRLSDDRLVIGGGIVFPVVVLSLLLVYSLFLTQVGARPWTDDDTLRIRVVGERWWWRVTYEGPDGERFASANEIRIPVGRPVAFELTSDNVVHSFWVPKLAGKLDMVPGRVNTLNLTAEEPGVSRGQCAEYCGGAHALMAFEVVAMPADDFDTWLAREAGDARDPTTAEESRGHKLFLAAGCGACHAVRGTRAHGVLGPDLTHVGGRRTLAAATLPADEAGFARWIADNQQLKPDNLMPPYRIFDEAELAALATYLKSLR